MNKQVAFKVGTSFRPTILYTPTEGLAPATLAGVTITSHVRTAEGNLIAELVHTPIDDSHFKLEAVDGTIDWPAGQCVEWDIAFTHVDFGNFLTETIDLLLLRAATKLTS